MIEKDYKLYGTTILNLKTQKFGLLMVYGKTNLPIRLSILQLVLIKSVNATTLNLITSEDLKMILKNNIIIFLNHFLVYLKPLIKIQKFYIFHLFQVVLQVTH